jgi:ABC 3 transport family
MSLWHDLLSRLPFEWAQFAFMRNALLALLIVAPLFAIMGTLVVNNRMAFFSDAIGHASLTGIGLGVLFGLAQPLWAMIGLSLLFGLAILAFQNFTRSPMETIISMSMSFTIALGVVILSRGGNFNRFSHYLIGDLLSITSNEVIELWCTRHTYRRRTALWLQSRHAGGNERISRAQPRKECLVDAGSLLRCHRCGGDDESALGGHPHHQFAAYPPGCRGAQPCGQHPPIRLWGNWSCPV